MEELVGFDWWVSACGSCSWVDDEGRMLLAAQGVVNIGIVWNQLICNGKHTTGNVLEHSTADQALMRPSLINFDCRSTMDALKHSTADQALSMAPLQEHQIKHYAVRVAWASAVAVVLQQHLLVNE
jgi:hypothetical protein